MTPWSSRCIVAGLLLVCACPVGPEPPPAEESSSGPESTTTTTTTTEGPGTTPMPTSTTTPDTSSTGADTTAGSTTTGPDDTSSSSSSGDPSTSGTTTGDPSTSGTTTGDPSTSGTTTGDPSTTSGSTTAGDPCDAGDGPDFAVTNNGFSDYVINGVNDPPLTLVRGCSYTFNVNAIGHPFLIKTVQGSGLGNQYNDGVVGNGTQNGIITWDVSLAAPAALFYNCQFHAPMTGTITIIDPL